MLTRVMDGESRFSRLEILPPDLGLEKLPAEYNADNHPQKVSLGAGVYRSEDGKHWILPAVKKVISLGELLICRLKKGFWRTLVIITNTYPSKETLRF